MTDEYYDPFTETFEKSISEAEKNISEAYVDGLVANLRMFIVVIRETDERLILRNGLPLADDCDVVSMTLKLVESMMSIIDDIPGRFSSDNTTIGNLEIFGKLCVQALIHLRQDHSQSDIDVLNEAFETDEVKHLDALIEKYNVDIDKFTSKGFD